jgi:hypothetical protein
MSKASNLWVTFEYGQEDRFSAPLGPYPFVQLTYSDIRVGEDGDEFIATLIDGRWVTQDGKKWSDVIIATDY